MTTLPAAVSTAATQKRLSRTPVSGEPRTSPARARRGDLWQLGEHRLLCGDGTDPAQVERLFAGARARLTITSPPYNIGSRNVTADRNRPGASKYLHTADALPQADYLHLLTASTHNALAHSDIVIVDVQMLAGNKVTLLEWLHHFRHDLIDVAIWDKGHGQPALARNILNNRFEFVWFLTKRRRKGRTPRTLFTADFRGTRSNVYPAPPRKGNPYYAVHAATFPLHLPLWLLQSFDSERGGVFDPFLGTGTTLIAAERLGRKCLGIEIEPAYCDIILKRWEQETGRTAERGLPPNSWRIS